MYFKDDATIIVAEDGWDYQIPLELSLSGPLGGDMVWASLKRTFEDKKERRMDTNKVFFDPTNFFKLEEDAGFVYYEPKKVNDTNF